MLVLSRKLNESLIIDNDIEIKILGIEDGKIKLGIVAPKDKKILRKEVLDDVKSANLDALGQNKEFIKNLFK